MDNPFKSPAVISFCPGILGIERGLKRAGVHPRVMAYVEIEAYIIANLVAGMEAGVLDPTPIWTDAKTFNASPFRGRIHGIIGGYPCTPFSLAGTREGENHPGHIYPAISSAIEASRPLWCLFENVAAHLTLGFDKVYQDLHRMGYNVETGIYTAEEIGAPHERQRLFILAVADSDCYGYGTGSGQIIGKGGTVKGKAQRKEWNDLLREWMRDVVRDRCQMLANSNHAQRRAINTTGSNNKGELNVSQKQEGTGSLTQCSETVANLISEGLERFGLRAGGTESEFSLPAGISNNKFPARPGEQQYDWEAPRTIESGLGCTVNGYNFREDLLRALGNSVVEQTAELAFIDLLKKHLKNV